MCLLITYVNFLVFIHGTIPEAFILNIYISEVPLYSFWWASSYFTVNLSDKEYYASKIFFPKKYTF